MSAAEYGDVLVVAMLATGGVVLWTLRTVFVARGRRVLATLFSAVEAVSFVAVVSRVIMPLSVDRLVGYGAGVALGTYLGTWFGNVIGVSGALEIRVILTQDCDRVATTLRSIGWPVTTARASGAEGEVAVLVTILDRKDKDPFLDDVDRVAPDAFWTVEDIEDVRVVRRSPSGQVPTGVWTETRE